MSSFESSTDLKSLSIQGKQSSEFLSWAKHLKAYILTLNLCKVLNQDYFLKDLKSFPLRFESYRSWKELLRLYLFEELRTQLSMCWNYKEEMCYSLITNNFQREKKKVANKSTISVSINRKDPTLRFELLKNSIVVIKKIDNKDLSCDSGRPDHIFGYINEIFEEQENILTSITVDPDIYKNFNPLENTFLKFIYFEISIMVSLRIFRSMESAMPLKFINALLKGERIYHTAKDLTDIRTTDCIPYYNHLNPSQRNLILNVLELVQGKANKLQVQLVKGPPGTGKTATISTLLKCLLYLKSERILVAAPSLYAVTELVKKTLLTFDDCSERWFRISNILIVGNEKRLDTMPWIERVYIKERLERLNKALLNIREAVELGPEVVNRERLKKIYYLLKDLSENSDDDIQGDSTANIPPLALSFLIRTFNSKSFDSFKTYWESCLRVFFVTLIEALQTIFNELPQHSFTSTFKNKDVSIDYIEKTIEFFTTIKLDFSKKKIFYGNQLLLLNNILRKIEVKKGFVTSNEVLNEANIVFLTLAVAGRKSFKSQVFTIAIIDEASQVQEADMALVFAFNKLKCLVLVGDEKQLPPVVLSRRLLKLGYNNSLFQRLLKLEYPYLLLDVQYRMHPLISMWPAKTFYEGLLINGDNVQSGMYCKISDVLTIYDVPLSNHEKKTERGYYNEGEELIIRELISKFKRERRDLQSIGVISPYKEQVKRMLDLDNVKRCISPSVSNAYPLVQVSTVDGFQGQEFDLVILSTVRSNTSGSIGFLDDARRLNVAITRSKYMMVVVCNQRTLSNNELWKSFLGYVLEHGAIYNKGDEVSLEKLLINELIETKKVEDIEKLSMGKIWEVKFSHVFKKKIEKIHIKKSLKFLLGQLIRFSQGKWPRHPLKMTERIGLMFEGVFVISKILNAFLIITVDVHRGSSRCKQILITWDLVENNDFERAIKNVENNLLLYTDEYIKRCKERDDAGGMTCPLEWAKDESFVWFKKKEENVMLEGTEVLLPKLYDLDDKLVNFLWRDHKGFASQALPLSLSNDEKKIVECKHNLLIMGRSGTGKTTAMLYRLLYYEIWSQTVLSKLNEYEDKFEEKKGHQLLITVNPMLCKSVKEEYSALLKTMMNIEQIQLPNPSESKLELRDFISCEDDAFPVITTYDNFLNLINQSLSFPFPKNPLVKVDYNIFQFGFFPRVDTSLNISCALLYTEIMAFIKGSVQSIMSDNGYIKVEDYLKIANQRSSIFDVSKRLCIYKEFRKYQFWKNTKNFEDTADRVFIIYKAVKREVESGIYKGRQVDFIYVDEVQDLSPAQLYLLRYISTNSTQFIFAGDTAQTVCHGCSFRFEKLKDLFYNEFGFKKNFEQLSLLQNFRTHRGIGNVSSILIDMMVRFFPNFIGDKEKENFERCGPQPVFLLDKTDILEELFSKESLVSFGSEQAILVRDEAMKEKVRAISNEEVLVLTVSEAKGLEFDDCLVYNFLSSCQEKGLWRQIYNFRDLGVRPPKFYMDSHASLFRELSMFYVLVTRAKEKLVIFEEREEARQPMIALLQHEKLVSTQRFSSNIVSLFIKSSSNETWTKKGELFLEKKQFSNAFICFTKANNKELATRCNAMSLEFRADTSDLSLYEEKKCYMDAGSLFSSLKNKYYEDAARCYSKGRCYQKAANFYEVCQKWAEAAECLEHMKNFNSAFELYIKAEEVQRAIQCLVKGASFEFGVTFLEEAIQKNKDKSLYCTKLIEAKNESIQKGAVYHRNRNNKDSMMYFVRLFPNLEQMKKFLSKSYPKELLLLEKENDNDSESAETYLKLFAYEEAAACYLKANNYQEALSCHVRLLRSQICPFIAENKVIRFDGNTIETLEKANRTVKVEKNFQCQCLLKELKFYNSLLHIEQSLLDDIYKEVKNEVGAWYLKLYVAQHAINCCRDNWKKLSCYNTELQMVISKFIQSCVPKKRSAQALDNRNLEIFRDVVEYFGMQLSNSVISTCITISADMDSSLSKQFQKENSVGTCDKLSSGLIKYFDYYTFCEVAEGLLRQLSLDVSYKVIECINNNLEDNKECFHELTDMLQILFEELMKVEPLISKEKLCELEGMKKKYCLELKNFLFPRFFPSGLDNAALVVELRQNEKMRAPLEYYITNYLSKSNFNENTLLTWLLQAELFDETFLRKQLFIIGDRLRNIYKTEELMFKIREIFLVRRSFPLDRLNYHYQESFYVLKNLLLMTLTRVDNHSTKFVSPHIFIKLLEKHCVFLLIQYTRVRNLLLTYSLASDWICRKNKRFTDVIRFMSKVNAVVYKTQELDYKNDAGNIESVYAYTGYRNSYEWKASVMRYDIERGNVAFNLKKQEKLEPILGEHLIKVLELLCLSLERLSLPYTNGEAKVQRWVRMTSLFSDKTNKKNVSSVIKKMINLYICILINIKEVNSNKYFADKWLQKLRFATYSEIFQSEFKEDRSFLYILEDLNIETIEDKFFSYLKTAGDTLITININRRPMTEEKSFRKAYYYIEMGEYPALTLKKEYLKNFSESFVNKSMEEVTKLNTVKTIENMVFTVLFLKVKYYAAKYRMTQLSRLQLSRRRTECELLKEKKIISRKTEGVKEYIQTVCRVIKKMESLIKKFQNLISTLKEGNFEFSLEEARTTVDNLSQNLSEILSCKSLTLQNSEELYERTNYVLNILNTNTKQASKKLTKISSDCNVPIK